MSTIVANLVVADDGIAPLRYSPEADAIIDRTCEIASPTCEVTRASGISLSAPRVRLYRDTAV